MKTIVRKDGQKFIVTNALYEEVKRKGLLEDLFDGKLDDDQNQGVQDNQSTGKGVQNNQSIVNDKINKSIKNTDFNKSLEFNDKIKYANEIKKGLADLVDIYRMHIENGLVKEPYVTVFRSEKFQKNYYSKWRRISNILSKKDEKMYSDSDKKILATVDLKLPPRKSMQEDLKKLYNL